MSVILAQPVESLDFDARLSDRALALRQRTDAEIPWWAIELLELRNHSREERCRRILRRTRPRFASMWNLYAELVDRAEDKVMQQPIEKWRELCYNDTDKDTGKGGDTANLIRDAALFNPRAFVTLCDLRDEEGNPIVLKDFHVDMLAAMRQTTRPAMIQAFWGGGKSWNSSTIVPLMDWAEWPVATEGRIYLDEDTVKKWTGRLMQIVEENDELHKLFPWIRKPTRNDPGHKIWSYDGFAIGGNPIKQRSFEGHTIGSSKTGMRFFRTGIDDVVSDKEAATASIQDRNLSYIKKVALTTRQILKRPRSKYGTVFPSIYTVGTPYDRGDVNVRLEDEYRQKGYKVVRVPIFISDDSARPRWAERDTPATIRYMKEEMGERAFNMRCRLKVGGREHSLFPEQDVDFAFKDGRYDPVLATWATVPPNTKLILGLDPGSGNRPTHHGARYPAWVLYGVEDRNQWRPERGTMHLMRDSDHMNAYGQPVAESAPDLQHHVIQWDRMEGIGMHSQCKILADLARAYGCPIAFEDNGVQIAYGEEIARIAPDVKTICHTTGMNKRDPAQGVDQFEPLFTNRKISFHASGAPPDKLKAMRDELINWKGSSEKTSGFTDLIMALWIARYQFNLNIQIARPLEVRQRVVPDYVARFTRWSGRG
jgi:hypothetical protein